MGDLRALDLNPGWIYETLVSTYRGGRPRATPIGVRTHDFKTVEMEIYNTSETLGAIRAAGEFTIGFPQGVEEIHTALLHPDRLAFTSARVVRAPEPAGMGALVEARLLRIDAGAERSHVRAEVVDVRTTGVPRPLNRAEPLLLEALVLLTKLPVVGSESARAQLAEYARVITKVAPGSRHERAVRELIDRLPPAAGAQTRS